MTDAQRTLLNAASAALAGALDIVEAVRTEPHNDPPLLGSGEVLECLVDAVRLTIEGTGRQGEDYALYQAVQNWLAEQV